MKIIESEWNKLVRDKVPQWLEDNGAKVEIRILDDEEYLKLLLSKLGEEAQEVAQSDNAHLLEELGDLETVIETILHSKGLTRKQLRAQQLIKDQARGGFSKRIYLISTKRKND
ncbi:nucleoside triphosphate pyrophosphohydrolase [Patescibacteria group bacterium]|nr:nucleoside triphosphate pyrophosphohydrolase [Patescibacteria group bacterium]